MTKTTSEIYHLKDWGLTPSGLTRLGNRVIAVCIQQKGPAIRPLMPLAPAERNAKITAVLARGLRALERRCPPESLVSRGVGGPAWTIDARVPAKTVVGLSRMSNVAHVRIDDIPGRRRIDRVETPKWFAVRGRVAIEVEGRLRGYQTVEDSIIMVRATSERRAERAAKKEWKDGEEPYLNMDGHMVRWRLEEIVDVHATLEDAIDEAGTEVYSSLAERRMRPEYEWHPRGRPA